MSPGVPVCLGDMLETAVGTADATSLREPASAAEAVEINREAFRAARALAQQSGEERMLLVTVQDTGGSFGLEPFGPWNSSERSLALATGPRRDARHPLAARAD